jgi:hypothetical protein
MRVLDSAIALSQEFDAELYVIWKRNSVLNSSFERLWKRPAPVTRIIAVDASTRVRSLLHKIRRRGIRFQCDHVLTLQRMNELRRLKYNGTDFHQLLDENSLFIRTGHRFYDSSAPFRHFEVVDSLCEVIDSYRWPKSRMVGVHIRRTDNEKSVVRSPTESFITQMHAELEVSPDTAFFLATDSPEEEKRLRQVFPHGKIVTHRARTLRRDCPEGIEDALVDLYCLSNCDKLIGSYWSSFSETAYQIRGIDHLIIQE